ncbi:4-carboxymuconolactone decarboxylase [Novosphingobium sp. SG751A]|uniref:(R)-mandelonitrile lyase n=1 Tax=Novosphingobium sp. SG751A TaxID=2587000 RepID=UPI0015531DDC|nr:carboxymuconolactone decarboxylase family protein [Novosphingobium sp. SG751A]NOW46485.1 4-carboxymuconolactone decarboxylase [Novosphingobium sp. SG751A]
MTGMGEAAAAMAMVAGLVPAEERPSVAPKAMHAVAPALADYTDKVLFGDVWERTELSPRDRSMVTLSVLIATGKSAQLGGHLVRGLNNGIKPSEVAGMVTHLAFYAGWPNAVSALNVIEPVFAERKIDAAQFGLPKISERPDTLPGIEQAEALAPKFVELTSRIIFADLWQRPELSPRDRSLVTIAAMAANGDFEQLGFYIDRARSHGWTAQQIGEVFTHLAFYAGWPKAGAAIALLARSQAPAKGETGLVVVAPGGDPTPASPANFTGSAMVSSPFSGSDGSRMRGATVRFEKGARTHWHSHPMGQLLIITAGHGWVQIEGQTPVRVRAGDTVWTPPGLRHWHGADTTTTMTHVAISETVEGQTVSWLGPVSDPPQHRP